jgi:hypothetical protein
MKGQSMTVEELNILLKKSFWDAAEGLGMTGVCADGSYRTDEILLAISRWGHIDDGEEHAYGDMRAMQNWFRTLGDGCALASRRLGRMRQTLRDGDGGGDREHVMGSFVRQGQTVPKTLGEIVQWTELPETEVTVLLNSLARDGYVEFVAPSNQWRKLKDLPEQEDGQ